MEAVLFHEMYHLLDQDHAHGRTKPFEEMTDKDFRDEEFCADEHAIIHGKSQHLKEYIKFFEKYDLDFQKRHSSEEIQEAINDLYLKHDPIHPPLPNRVKYFQAAYKEKKALEERLAKETPEENEENLRKLLERGPRRSLPYSDTPSTARLQ